MNETVAQILAQVETLSTRERAEIAYAVLQSLEPEESGVEQAWDEELERRVAKIRSGQATGRPAKDALDDWRRSRS
jgi:putative addiction module component (TIGR02574 family)